MRKYILIIEDDLPTIDVYKTLFENGGFRIEVLSYKEAVMEKLASLERPAAKKPDLVILDIILPDINGIDILTEIRRGKRTKDLPVFLLTNYTDREMEKMGKKLKAEKFLLKTDYTPTKLLDLISKRLKVKK